MLSLREQHKLVHQRLPGFCHFKRAERDSGELGIDAYLPRDGAAHGLCRIQIAECTARCQGSPQFR
jgi:hypothetical protein